MWFVINRVCGMFHYTPVLEAYKSTNVIIPIYRNYGAVLILPLI